MAAKAKTTDPNKPKRTRKASVKYFLANINGSVEPVVIIAKTQADALNGILKLKPGTPADLMQAGKDSWRVIDTTDVGSTDTPS